MTTTTEHTITDRIFQLLQHLGIKKAHFASRTLGDLTGLTEQHPEMFASLTMVCPAPPSVDIIRPIAPGLLVFRGTRSDYDSLGQIIESLPEATLAILQNDIAWSDLVALHKKEILSTLMPFLAKQTTR